MTGSVKRANPQVFKEQGGELSLYAAVPLETRRLVVGGLVRGSPYSISVTPVLILETRRMSDAPVLGFAGRDVGTARHPRRLAEALGTFSNVTLTTPTDPDAVSIQVLQGVQRMTYGPDDHLVVSLTAAEDDTSNALDITFTLFDLECDHDHFSVWIDDEELWTGGCRRLQEFTLTVPLLGDAETVSLRLDSDGTVEGAGVEFSYRAYASVGAVTLVLGTPEACPGAPVPCSGGTHGACMVQGICKCVSGYTGEDCSGHVMCPGPLCAGSPGNVPSNTLVVAPWGNDTIGTGWAGFPHAVTAGGTVPKPLATLRRALELASPTTTIVMFSGTFIECGLRLEGNNHRQHIVGVAYAGMSTHVPASTIIDCASEEPQSFLVAVETSVQLSGLVVVNSNSGALRVSGGKVSLAHVAFENNTATTGGIGGAVTIESGGVVTVSNVAVTKCSSVDGGGVFVGALSSLVTEAGESGLVISACTALRGGGVFVDAGTFKGGSDGEFRVVGNNATLGGNMYARGDSLIERAMVSMGVAMQDGGGLYVEGESALSLRTLRVTTNWALGSEQGQGGGGIFAASGAVISTSNVSVASNEAMTGGGILLSGNSVLSGSSIGPSTLVSANRGCAAGGGIGVVLGALIRVVQVTGNCARCCSNVSRVVATLTSPAGAAHMGGGGMWFEGGSSTLQDVSLAWNAVGAGPHPGLGGGLLVTSNGQVVAMRVGVHNNSVNDGHGGGISLVSGSRFVGQGSTTVRGNWVSGCGGGLSLAGGSGASALSVEWNSAAVAVGSSQEWASAAGAGACVTSGAGQLTEIDLLHNVAVRGMGGGVAVMQNARGTTVDVRVAHNEAAGGAGVFVGRSGLCTGSASTAVTHNAAVPAPGGHDWDMVSRGGGVLCDACEGITGLAVHGNSATEGAGVFVASVRHNGELSLVQGCDIEDNVAADVGGGVGVSRNASALLRDVSVTRNHAARGGGGLWIVHADVRFAVRSSPSLSGVTLRGNTARNGGGVFVQAGSLRHAAYPGPCGAASRLTVDGGVAVSGGGVFMAPDTSDGPLNNHTGMQCVAVVACTAVTGGGIHVAGSGSLQSDPRAFSVRDTVVTSCHATKQGGGLNVVAAGAALGLVTISDCTCGLTASGHLSGGRGGGIAVSNASVVTADHLVVTGCVSAQGGGVFADSSSVTGQQLGMHVSQCSAFVAGGGAVVRGKEAALVRATVTNCTAPVGGGIAVLEGSSVALHNTTVTKCVAAVAEAGGGGNDAHGGGVAVYAGASANLTACVVSHCVSGRDGGGIHVMGTANISTACVLGSNHAARRGGGLLVSDGAFADVSESVLEFNSAVVGGAGAAVVDWARLRMSSATMFNNVANAEQGFGGGVLVSSATVDMESCTILHTLATPAGKRGGGLYISTPASAATGDDSQVDVVAAVHVTNTVIDGSSAAGGGGVYAHNALVSMTGSLVRAAAATEFGGCIFAEVSCAGVVLASAVTTGVAML